MPALLFVSYSGVLGGAERVLLDCSEAIAGDHILACPDGPLAVAARGRGLRVVSLSQRRLDLRGDIRDRVLAPWRLAGHTLELRRLVGDLAPDLTVAWGMRSVLACALVAFRRGFAFSHHDFLPGPLIAVAVRAAAARAGVVIASSHAVAHDLDPGDRLGHRLRVVHPGVDGECFAPGERANPPEVLVLGALTAWKRPDLALEICALARSAFPSLRLRFVGGPVTPGDPVPERLRARAARPDLAGAVEFAGPREDPRADLLRASCLLHCASREPFGIALIEALAAGRPVVAPNAGGPREIVDPSCGWLYPPEDAGAGAEALTAVLADPARAEAMGAAGRERARSQFARGLTRAGFADAVGPLLPPGAGPRLDSDRLTLLTVTHNSAAALEALMASVQRHLPAARMIVVDCNSRDRSVAVGRAGAQVIELGENVGFGRACNRGLREVRTPVTALINPDVELLDDSVLALAAEAMRPEAPPRLLAPLVLNDDGTRQDTVHPVPASAPDLVAALLPPGIVPGPAGAMLAPWRSRAPRRVGWAVGAALVAPTETLIELGPFDETIFMYGEDIELGLRAARSGVETWFWPTARVLHHSAHSTLTAFAGEPFERLARARHDTVARRLGARRAVLDDGAQAVTFGSRIVLKRALRRPTMRERRQLSAVLSLRSSRLSRAFGRNVLRGPGSR